ncbi:zinc finger MYM-type protein 1-like [Montipora foliosa]|uniref:zinc finger MYM-type protein 1-like n=1 Tax=Montipora foliosa TaxID=591990 RepID=UPI0035F1F495
MLQPPTCHVPWSSIRWSSKYARTKEWVATQIQGEVPSAIPVHCLAHCIQLVLQEAGRKYRSLREALELVKEIVKLSPKRSTLFAQNLENYEGGVTLKPLCPTRWTVRTAAFSAVLEDYLVLQQIMEDLSDTTHDEYGLRANGVLSSLDKLDSAFGLKLGYLLFGAAEQLSRTLQGKDMTLQVAITAANLAKNHYTRLRTEAEFDKFYQSCVSFSEGKSGEPVLQRYRRAPARLDHGATPHRFKCPKDYYRVQCYEACDKMKTKLESRFNQAELKPVSNLEKLLVGAANSDDFSEHLEELQRSCFGTDIDCGRLGHQLYFVHDAIKTTHPEVRQVTNIRTICEAFNKTPVTKTQLGEVHKLLRLYSTLPVASATSERTFSSLRRLKTYLRSTMNQNRLNNCLLLHCQKSITDTLDTVDIAKKFVRANEQRNRHFGKYE